MTDFAARPHREVMSGDELTVAILREIRDEIRATNARVDVSNERLDKLAEGQIRIATEVAELRGEVCGLREEVGGLRGEVGDLRGEVGGLRGEVGGLRGEVRKQGDRLENAILTGGQMFREFRFRLDRLERHVGLEPA